VSAIFFRENDRLLKRTGSDPQAIPDEFKQLDTENPPPLDVVWSTTSNGANASQIYATAYSVITYIDQEYGQTVVTRLLRSIGQAKSFSEAIHDHVGVPFSEFEQKWRAWAQGCPVELRQFTLVKAVFFPYLSSSRSSPIGTIFSRLWP
jgi:hypothetical protein